jgi:capsular exopolysaccharide synthesis family protein
MNEQNQYPQQYDPGEDEGINFTKYFFLILSNWYWIILSLIVALTVAYLVNRYSQPQYTVTTTLLISDQPSSMTGIESLIEELSIFRRRSRKDVLNEIERLKSYKIIYSAIQELDFEVSYTAVGRREIAEKKLYKDSPFIVNYNDLGRQRKNLPVHIYILSDDTYRLEIESLELSRELRFGEQFTSSEFDFSITLRNPQWFNLSRSTSNKYYFTFHDLHSLTTRYRNKLKINMTDKLSSILKLSVTGNVAEKETDFLNKIAEIFIRYELQEKNEIAENTITFIEGQLDNIRDSLIQAQDLLLTYQVDQDIVDLSAQGEKLFEKITELQERRTELYINQRYFDYLLERLSASEEIKSIILPTELDVNEQLNKLIAQINDLYIEKNTLEYQLEKANPVVNNIQAKLAELKNRIETIIENSKESNAVSIREIEEQIAQYNQQLISLPRKERELLNLERRVKLNDDLVTFLLEKRAEAGIAKSSNVPGNEVLDEARVQNAYMISPKKKNNYMKGLMAGLGIPIVILLLLDYFNNKIRSKHDIESLSKISILGLIGHNHYDSHIPVVEQKKSSIAESFRALRTNLKYLQHEGKAHLIAINSTISGEGKTFTAVNLAAILALVNYKVLVIGVDLRKPRIHRLFDIPNDKGLSTYLSGMEKYDNIVHNTDMENLQVIPAGPIPPNPAELLESPKMDEFVKKASNDYDYIIFDTPPLAIVSDSLYISKFADTNVFVVRQNYSSKGSLKLINELHATKRMKQVHLVVNDIRHTLRDGYSYGYSYGYGYGYGYKYGYGKYKNRSEDYYTDTFPMTRLQKFLYKLDPTRRTRKL